MDNNNLIVEARPQFEPCLYLLKYIINPWPLNGSQLLFGGGLYSRKYGNAVANTNFVFVCGHVDLLCHGTWVGHVEKYFVIVVTYHISNRGFLQIETSSV